MTATATEFKGFNGIYTIQNDDTGEYRTFSVRRQKDDARFAPGERIAALLTGRDNENDYTCFAFVRSDASLATWKSKRGGAFDHYARMLEKALLIFAGAESETATAALAYGPNKYTVALAKRCYRCNRTLTTPESIRLGYGPDCAEKLGL